LKERRSISKLEGLKNFYTTPCKKRGDAMSAGGGSKKKKKREKEGRGKKRLEPWLHQIYNFKSVQKGKEKKKKKRRHVNTKKRRGGGGREEDAMLLHPICFSRGKEKEKSRLIKKGGGKGEGLSSLSCWRGKGGILLTSKR